MIHCCLRLEGGCLATFRASLNNKRTCISLRVQANTPDVGEVFISLAETGGINLFRIYSNRSIYIERTQFIHLEKIARDYEQVVSRTLHVDVGC